MYTIYGKPNCPWCDRAKGLLQPDEYNYVDVSKDQEAKEVLVEMGVRTVPQVFDRDNHIGGFEALKWYVESLGKTQKQELT